MFQLSPQYVKRVSFASRLFPTLKSGFGVNPPETLVKENKLGFLSSNKRSQNKELLLFFGLLGDTPAGSSTFMQLPLLRRSIKKLIDLVEIELQIVGAQEVLAPTIMPLRVWEQSQRLTRDKDALNNVFHFVDANDRKVLLGPTFEESFTWMVKHAEKLTESSLPLLLYQTSAKFRRESNPKFGLIRSNEFIMNDLYTFDSSLANAEETYRRMSDLYKNLFIRLGLECIQVESSTGDIGGKYSHEYQLPVTSGQDIVLQCQSCGASYNDEFCKNDKLVRECKKCGSSKFSQCATLELGHSFLLSDTYSKPMNAMMTMKDGRSVYIEMGCYGLGLTRIIGAGLDKLSFQADDDKSNVKMRWPTGIEPFMFGFVSPAKRSKQYNAGSTDYIQRLVSDVIDATRNVDILVEDRDRDGIMKRVGKLQSLGVPNIVVVGNKFLQDVPEVELLTLDSEKKLYNQRYLTRNQILDFIKRLDDYVTL